MGADYTKYSERIKGDRGNYDWPVRFDISTSGYLGINQYDEDGTLKERVLLSPGQVKILLEFSRGSK